MTYRFAEKSAAMYTRLLQRYSQGIVVGVLKRRGIVTNKVNQTSTTTVTNVNLNGVMMRYDQEEVEGDLTKMDDIKFIADAAVVVEKSDGDFITINSVDYRIVNVHRIEWNGVLVGQEMRLAK
jgi:hypothetical protein